MEMRRQPSVGLLNTVTGIMLTAAVATEETVELPSVELPKGEREYRAFLRLLPELLRTHHGQHVAIHNEQVIDADSNEVALILRVQAQVGYVPLCIALVSEEQPVQRIPHYHAPRPRP
jgi:hypothetical protein